MKRSPIKRKTRLTRKTRIKAVNRKRKAKRYEENFGERAAAVRQMVCLLRWTVGDPDYPDSRCDGPVEPAHVRSRGAGGNRRDLVPLCHGHHAEQHQAGILTFEAKYGLDLRAEADAVAYEFDGWGLP